MLPIAFKTWITDLVVYYPISLTTKNVFNITDFNGVCGPQKGVNLGQNERFPHISEERKLLIDFKTSITDLSTLPSKKFSF